MSKKTNLRHYLQKSIELYSSNTALVINNISITYKQIHALAKYLAEELLKNTVIQNSFRIIVFAEGNLTSYVGLLTSIIAGATYIPLNPRHPLDRNILILKQCQADAIITDLNSYSQLKKISEHINLSISILCPDLNESPFQDYIENTDKTNIGFSSVPDDKAYILFTSGSTGEPKGVPISHRNICSFLDYCQQRYQISSNDRFSQTFEHTFDLSLFNILMAWTNGASVTTMRPIDLLAPAKYINDNTISIWFSVPSVLDLLIKQNFLRENTLPSLRLSLFCGESLYIDQIQQWAKAAPNSVCENLYGPTELTIACSSYQYNKDSDNEVFLKILSIGKLFPHLDYVLIDEERNENKTRGELCVSGPQCFSGYLNNDIFTKEAFIELVDNNQNKKIYYRTGDRVILSKSGNLMYIGRIDQQVKINGYRVELAEIEAVIANLDKVEKVVVGYIAEEKQLTAFIIGDVTKDEVLKYLCQKLPSYMIPNHIFMESITPLNTNGKIDRKLIQKKITSSSFI